MTGCATMRFTYDLTVPAATTKAEPELLDVRLVLGRLFHVEVAIPPGPANRVSVVVKDALLQIIPANPEQSLGWDDYIHQINLDYELDQVGHELTLVGWSPTAEFDHTITFHFDVEPAEEGGEKSVLMQIAASLGLPGR